MIRSGRLRRLPRVSADVVRQRGSLSSGGTIGILRQTRPLGGDEKRGSRSPEAAEEKKGRVSGGDGGEASALRRAELSVVSRSAGFARKDTSKGDIKS